MAKQQLTSEPQSPVSRAIESVVITGAIAGITCAISAFTPLLHAGWEVAAATALGTAAIRFLQGIQSES